MVYDKKEFFIYQYFSIKNYVKVNHSNVNEWIKIFNSKRSKNFEQIFLNRGIFGKQTEWSTHKLSQLNRKYFGSVSTLVRQRDGSNPSTRLYLIPLSKPAFKSNIRISKIHPVKLFSNYVFEMKTSSKWTVLYGNRSLVIKFI